MCDFNNITRCGYYLYRGSHGDEAKEIMSCAVGPVRKVAAFIVGNDLNVDNALLDNIYKFFVTALQPVNSGEINNVYAPGNALANKLGRLLQNPALAPNQFTVFEHVLYEPEGQINSYRTSRLLESVSKDPRVAILYAYGIDPDFWFDNNRVQFSDDQPNSEAFVAVLARAQDSPLAEVNTMSNIFASNLTTEEARRRIDRDQEVLLEDAETPSQIIDLPDFDIAKPLDSLNQAATELVNKRVVQ